MLTIYRINRHWAHMPVPEHVKSFICESKALAYLAECRVLNKSATITMTMETAYQ